MRRTSAIIASAVFLAVAPGLVAVLVPWWISRWQMDDPFFGVALSRLPGVALVVLGAFGLLDSFARFALEGLGTPAPILPTKRLVVTGLYRYVRNPMYISVTSAILGQSLIFGNFELLEYGVWVWLMLDLFVLLYEEPTLKKTFGPGYEAYRAAVPKWIPRLTPWKG